MLTLDVEALRRLIREELAAGLAAAAPPASPPPPDPANFSDGDLCRRWRRSMTYVKAVRRDGHLRSVKFGSRWVTPLAEIRRIETAGLPAIGPGGRAKAKPATPAVPLFGKARS